MPQITLTLHTLTPLLMFGAENKGDTAQPELRAPSFRGVLRYWLRAVLAAQVNDPSQLFERESQVFGSTDHGSAVRVRVQPLRAVAAGDSLRVLPQRLSQRGFRTGGDIRLTLSTHPLADEALLGGNLLRALYLALHLGGFGKRARRGGGDFAVAEADLPPEIALPDMSPLDYQAQDGHGLAQYLTDVCRVCGSRAVALHDPDYPTFAPQTARVLVSAQPFRDYSAALDDMWSLSGKFHHYGGAFGDVRPRRASAIHMRVNRSGAGYHPVVTVLRSGRGDWSAVQSFMDAFTHAGYRCIYTDGRGW